MVWPGGWGGANVRCFFGGEEIAKVVGRGGGEVPCLRCGGGVGGVGETKTYYGGRRRSMTDATDATTAAASVG